MEDIRSVLSMYKSRLKKSDSSSVDLVPRPIPEIPTVSEIPDVFFDEILNQFKISRVDISVLMYLYRQVWCRPNLYRDHGIGPLNSYNDLTRALHLDQTDLMNSLKSLESLHLILPVRAGQYFVRKFFTEEFDIKYAQHYEF